MRKIICCVRENQNHENQPDSILPAIRHCAYGVIYTSGDSGVTWIQTSLPTNYVWSSVACSAEGTRQVAAAQGSFNPLSSNYAAPGVICYSVDSGATWAVVPLPSEYWNSVICSADGTKLVGLAQGGDPELGLGIGRIYSLSNPLFRPAPSPPLTMRPCLGNLGISWLIPSTNFVLQQNDDLSTTNWTDMPTVPTLNYTNLNYEVTVSPSPGSHFYRLRSP